MASIEKEKCDTSLGEQVEAHLRALGLHTPTTDKLDRPDSEKIDAIRDHFEKIMDILGLDLNDDSLAETPSRVAKMFVKEIFAGLKVENFPKCTTVENKMATGKEFVLERKINLSSSCEHHFLPIMGYATVAYIPKDKVLGLSKMNRLVRHFMKRPQIQERLTVQIKEALSVILGTPDVAVYIDAKHTCVSTRGIEDFNSSTVTLAAGGAFQTNDLLRSEFLTEARKG